MLSDSKHNVLIINPNSTQSMTDSLSDLIGPASEKVLFMLPIIFVFICG